MLPRDDGKLGEFVIVRSRQIWNGLDDQGRLVRDGVYPFRVNAQTVRIETPGEGEKTKRKVIDSIPEASGQAGVDDTPPEVTPVVAPPANARGWNMTDVVVSFICRDDGSSVADCPGPISVTTEGPHQAIEAVAIDRAGNSAKAIVTLNIDKTRPVVSVNAPVDGSTTQASPISVTGTVQDANPISALRCNDLTGVLSGASFRCDGVPLLAGINPIVVEAVDIADNAGSTRIEVNLTEALGLSITDPENLSLFNRSPISVVGTVTDAGASVTVNGVIATVTPEVSGATFTATVPLREGNNILTATAAHGVDRVATASIQVALDTTPPRVVIDSPTDGSTVAASPIVVTGLVNDVVVGTVNGDQARVSCNGVEAQVANRSFAAAGVTLTAGPNTIICTGTDRAGNARSSSVSVTFDTTPRARLTPVSGNLQSGRIGQPLPEPLVVALTDEAGDPVPGRRVIFKVVQNDGTVSGGGMSGRSVLVTTDAAGRSQVHLTLGDRAGAGNNEVQATTVGFEGEAVFCASALPADPASIVVDMGNNQRGVVGQPLPRPFVAVVIDRGSNRLAHVPVTFTVKRGGGNLGGQPALTVSTDSDGRAQAVLALGAEAGFDNNLVEASFPGIVGSPSVFVASAVLPADPARTRVSGVVLDNTDAPIPGATVRIRDTVLSTSSDSKGHFLIEGAPVGRVLLDVEGSTVQRPGTWPNLEFEMVLIAGQDNTVGRGPIYLLPLEIPGEAPGRNKACVDEAHGGTITLVDVPGFALTIPPGSATFPDGSRSGCVTVTPVHPDKVPMVPNFGQQPRFVVTIQPAGTHFDPPAPLALPNADGLAPGQKTEMYSFDHDLGQFVSMGPGTVSADGTIIRTDPGVGVIKGGWHCGGNPAGAGTCEHECDDGNACTDDKLVNDTCQHPPKMPEGPPCGTSVGVVTAYQEFRGTHDPKTDSTFGNSAPLQPTVGFTACLDGNTYRLRVTSANERLEINTQFRCGDPDMTEVPDCDSMPVTKDNFCRIAGQLSSFATGTAIGDCFKRATVPFCISRSGILAHERGHMKDWRENYWGDASGAGAFANLQQALESGPMVGASDVVCTSGGAKDKLRGEANRIVGKAYSDAYDLYNSTPGEAFANAQEDLFYGTLRARVCQQGKDAGGGDCVDCL